MSLVTQQPLNMDELHTVAVKKKDVGLVAHALAFCYANREAGKLSAETAESVKELFEFFKSVYNSKGTI